MDILKPYRTMQTRRINNRLEDLSSCFASELIDDYYQGNSGPYMREVSKIPRGIHEGTFMRKLYDSIEQKLGHLAEQSIIRDEEAILRHTYEEYERVNIGVPEDIIVLSGVTHAVAYRIQQREAVGFQADAA